MFECVPSAIRERLILADEPHPVLLTRCWLCIAGRFTPNGYARIYDAQRNLEVVLHRFLYKLLINPNLPRELLLDHLCRVRNCVNPEHLEPVPPGVNTHRGKAILYKRLTPTQGHNQI